MNSSQNILEHSGYSNITDLITDHQDVNQWLATMTCWPYSNAQSIDSHCILELSHQPCGHLFIDQLLTLAGLQGHGE